MKKLIVSICTALCLLASPLAALEWGGLIFNDSGITTPDFKDITFKQSDGISLWLKSPLGDNSGFYFSAEALYKFNLEIPKGGKAAFTQIADLPLLKVSGDIELGSGLFSLNAGRFYYADGTGNVISQVVDGASAAYKLASVNIGAFAAYTGLLNALNVPMAAGPEKENKIYNLAYPFLPLGLSLELPTLAGNQSLQIEAYELLDFGANKTNLTFANLILSGPITNSLYYNAATSFGFAEKTVMNCSSLALLLFPTESISLNAGVTFGSGEQGPFGNFVSLAPASLTAAGTITPKAAFTFTSGDMCLDLGANFVLAYADSKYAPANTNVNLGFIYNILSDLQTGLTVNTTFDMTEAKTNKYEAKLNISLAF